jgi:hypothetical protein
MFEGQVEPSQRINLLYEVIRHYHVITNLIGATKKQYVCKACNKGFRNDVKNIRDQTCSDGLTGPPCVSAGVRIPCDECQTLQEPNVIIKTSDWKPTKSVCKRKRCCGTCGVISQAKIVSVTDGTAKTVIKTEIGHLSYMRSLRNELPTSDRVLYVFYDFETTQNTRYSEMVHVPNFVCVQQLFEIRKRGRYRARLRAVRQEEALVLGRSGRGHVTCANRDPAPTR